MLIAFVVLVRFIGFLLFLCEQIKCMYVQGAAKKVQIPRRILQIFKQPL